MRSPPYSVIVSNASGSVTSQVARLKVFLSNSTAHSLSGIDTHADGSVGLTFKGETTLPFAPYYDLYPLEASSNLVDWMPLALLQRANGEPATLRFVDADAPKFSQRFYRTPTNALVTPIPQPTGPYPVGSFSMLLTDPSRTNIVRHTNYQFMITFWYPAVAQAGVFPALFVDKQVAMCGVYVIAGGSSWSNRLVAFFSHSLSNAPLATNLLKYPIVLYSPGWTGQRRDNTDKAEDLASWGYVVVGLDHRDTYLSVLSDGTLLHGQNKLTDTLNAIPTIEDRLRDEQLVLDELQSLNANDPRLGGRLDLDKIGVFGFSLGGSTAAQLCLRDPRCKAGAHFDAPYYESNMLTQTLSVPFLFFCEDDSPSDESPPNSDELPVFNHMVTNAYWVKLKSTNHGCFSDWDLILDSASMASGWGTPVSGQFLAPAG
jgi:predicted dienelactone hydrolase